MKFKELESLEVQPYPSNSAKNATGRVAIGKADGAKNYCMRILEMGEAGNTAFHSHEWEHEVFVHSGQGQVYGNDMWYDCKPGDTVFIPGNEEHQFRNTSTAPFVIVCVIPAGYPEL